MRLSLGFTLISSGAANLLGEHPPAIAVAQDILGAAAGAFVIAGLWTPVTATLAALGQIWIALSSQFSLNGDAWAHTLLGVLCASVALLGPGAWSIDARLFGRRSFPAYPNRKNHPPKG